jgi:hypothetical protein
MRGSFKRRLGAGLAASCVLVGLIPAVAQALPDGRAWELVSPFDKNGAGIAAPGTVAGGGVMQAAADGNSITYSSATAFGPDVVGAPPGSQYLSGRVAGGWSTANLDVPVISGSFGADPDGVPYQLFSSDLGRGLMVNGMPCRSDEAACPVANPPLPGTGAPEGYQNYYLRQGGSFTALIGAEDLAHSDLDAAHFRVRFAGASADLGHALLETCAALTADATETALGAGCDPAASNLYDWTAAGGLELVNQDPAGRLASPAGAVSGDGSRIYFTAEPSPGQRNLYLRDGAVTNQADADASGGGAFQAATPDGAVAFFTKAGHLYRYDAAADAATDLTPGGEVLGLLGTASDGSVAYFATPTGLYVWRGGAPQLVVAAPSGDPSPTVAASSYPAATGTAHVDASGAHLAFVSAASLTGYNNLDQVSGEPDSQVFYYDSGEGALRCVSCRLSGLRPTGASSLPGARPNGRSPSATTAYKPHALAADGRRLFFDSLDAVVIPDTNKERDAYQWEALGKGSCVKPAGCVDLISSGRAEGGATFVDASTSGDDVFFVTDGSLVSGDGGGIDLYDARVGGGFPTPSPPIACLGDACQVIAAESTEPTLSTLVAGPGNPKVRYRKYGNLSKRDKARCGKNQKSKGSKCKNKKGQAKNAKGGRR